VDKLLILYIDSWSCYEKETKSGELKNIVSANHSVRDELRKELVEYISASQDKFIVPV